MTKLEKTVRTITEYNSNESRTNFPVLTFLSYEIHTDSVSKASSEYLRINILLSQMEKVEDYECIRSKDKIRVSDYIGFEARGHLKRDLKQFNPDDLEDILSQITPEARSMIKAILE